MLHVCLIVPRVIWVTQDSFFYPKVIFTKLRPRENLKRKLNFILLPSRYILAIVLLLSRYYLTIISLLSRFNSANILLLSRYFWAAISLLSRYFRATILLPSRLVPCYDLITTLLLWFALFSFHVSASNDCDMSYNVFLLALCWIWWPRNLFWYSCLVVWWLWTETGQDVLFEEP